jgi:SOS-response transcriptional repressor LexA
MNIASRLQELLGQRGLTQSRVARLTGLSYETVNRIITGTTPNPQIRTLAKIADALDVTVSWVLGEKGFELSPRHRAELHHTVDVVLEILRATQPEKTELQPSNVSAVALDRKPGRARRHGQATAVAASPWRESFGARLNERDVDVPDQFVQRGATHIFVAEGDSMIDDHIMDGDLLYVREEPDPKHARGRIVVCVVGGSPYVKRLEFAGRKIKLVSANDRFAPMVFDEDSIEWSLVGVVVGWSHDAR